MEKEKLIKLLTSEDKELSKLGIEMLKSNYKIPKTLYCDHCIGRPYDFNLKEGKFEYKDNHILGVLEMQVEHAYWLENYELNSLLDVIITYNGESNKR